jgi:PD-(D/E)XK nuclease superfamily
MADDKVSKRTSSGKGTVVTTGTKLNRNRDMGFDTPSASKPTVTRENGDIAIISTSDRNAFRSCRRKWNWSSHLRQGLSKHEQAHPLWFGSGMHHVLEDVHGLREYKSVEAAVEDYCQATKKHHGAENLPATFDQDQELMLRMMHHYQYGFLKAGKRDPLKTYVIKGVPQVEVPFEFEIPLPQHVLDASGYKKAIYRGMLDRVVIDDDGYLWLVDYKNVAAFTQLEHLELDSQIGVYLWAASYIYERPVLGFIYTQLKKQGVEPPRILKNGEISTAKDQNTTHAMYRAALIKKYGEEAWPEDNVQTLNHLASLEEPEADKFVRRDRVTRSPNTMRAEANKILAEVTEMLNLNLPIYPNPSFMCPRMCSFIEPCLEQDRGGMYRTRLDEDYFSRDYKDRNTWRKHLQITKPEEKPPVQIVAKSVNHVPYKRKEKAPASKSQVPNDKRR